MKMKLFFMLALMSICSLTVNASLVHRYDFSVDASDSVGTAHGTLGTGIIEDGQLKTDGSTTGVSLPAAAVAGITGAFTIDIWYFAPAPQGAYHTLFSFDDGTTDNFIIGVPVRDGGFGYDSSVHVRQADVTDTLLRGECMDVWGDNPDQAPRRMVLTYDGTTLSHYQRDILAPRDNNVEAIGVNLEALATQIDIASGAPFPDPSLIGSVFDFRIYDSALTANQVAATFALGEDATNAQISAVVPEPATLILLGLGGFGLLPRRKK